MALEHVRKNAGRILVSLDASRRDDEGCEAWNLPDRGISPEKYCEYRQQQDELFAAVGALGPTNRRVFEMCVLQELPHVEVATLLNVSVSTIKSRIFRSRRELNQAISKR